VSRRAHLALDSLIHYVRYLLHSDQTPNGDQRLRDFTKHAFEDYLLECPPPPPPPDQPVVIHTSDASSNHADDSSISSADAYGDKHKIDHIRRRHKRSNFSELMSPMKRRTPSKATPFFFHLRASIPVGSQTIASSMMMVTMASI
jgi:hypothetical protein